MKKTVRSLKLLFLVLVLASSAVMFSFSVSSLADDAMSGYGIISEQELRANFEKIYGDSEYYDDILAYCEDWGFFTDPLILMSDEEFCDYIIEQGLPADHYIAVKNGKRHVSDDGRFLFWYAEYEFSPRFSSPNGVDVVVEKGATPPDLVLNIGHVIPVQYQILIIITSIAHYAEIGSDDVLSQMTTDECIDFVLKNGIEIPAELKEKSANLGQFIKNVIIRFEADGRPVSWEDNTAAEMEIPAFILQIRDAVEAFHAENATDSVN